MIDVISIRASTEAGRAGALMSRSGIMALMGSRHSSANGTLTFPDLAPTMYTRWKAAEVVGVFAHDSVRVRFSDGSATLRFLDTTTMTFEPVTNTAVWDTEWTEPSMLTNLDLWTAPVLGFVVYMVRTEFDRDPQVIELRVLADFPTWHGPIVHCVRAVVQAVQAVCPLLIHTETTASALSAWKIGAPHSEHGFDLTELVQMTVNGQHRSATLASGVVTVAGDPVLPNREVEIAVRFRPQTSVKRVKGVTTIDRVPAWVVEDLVLEGGLNGRGVVVSVGGYETETRRVELRLTIRGVAGRTIDALAMRAALQEAFALGGLSIELPSKREIPGYLDGFVEVIDRSGNALPQAMGTISVPITEFVTSSLVRRGRDDADAPVYTSTTLDLYDVAGDALTNVVNFASIIDCD